MRNWNINKQSKTFRGDFPLVVLPTVIILKTISIFFTIFCITGCYTILTPPSMYLYKQENQTFNEEVDTTIVTDQYINNYYCANCVEYENSCSSIYWRHNSWTGKYYCDPYYYNYSYYNHHYNNNYWRHSHYDWNDNDYSSHSYSNVPSKKTRRNRSFTRIIQNPYVESTIQEDINTTTAQSDNYNSQFNNTNSENTENSAKIEESKTKKKMLSHVGNTIEGPYEENKYILSMYSRILFFPERL